MTGKAFFMKPLADDEKSCDPERETPVQARLA
jgi:hypothetical protein